MCNVRSSSINIQSRKIVHSLATQSDIGRKLAKTIIRNEYHSTRRKDHFQFIDPKPDQGNTAWDKSSILCPIIRFKKNNFQFSGFDVQVYIQEEGGMWDVIYVL